MADVFPIHVRAKHPINEDAAQDGGVYDGWGVSSGLRSNW